MSIQFDRFTERTRKVLTVAQSEAQRLGYSYIGPEHLLLALAQEESGIACEILQISGVSLPLVKERVEQLIEPGKAETQEKLSLTSSTKRVIELAVDEARSFGYEYIGTEHLLVGLIREGSGISGQVLSEMNITLDQVRTQMQLIPREKASVPVIPTAPRRKISFIISPIFVAIVLITMVAGYLAYQREFNPSLTVFAFVTGGWIISLCLHEFGHAIVAYWGGDRAVAHKGYLTLNPIKYTHSILSIVLPLIYLALGGIGLPGGAVYINPGAIRKRWMRSLTSAAGPIATAICAFALMIPFLMGIDDLDLFTHFEFWTGLAFLASLEITALIFNILPIPGLDGFGLLAPFLPEKFLSSVRGFGPYTLVLIFVLFANDSFSQGFWTFVNSVTSSFNIDGYLIYEGFRLFQFWKS